MTHPQSTRPTVDLIPLHGAIVANKPITLDVLVLITPPAISNNPDRPSLNLSLVIDRSGSMQGYKIKYARQAAEFAVKNLLQCDRASVVLFDDRIEILMPSTLLTNKNSLLKQLRKIHTRGSTALHAGWVEGSTQVSQYLNPAQLNHVILLSDGLANVGETCPDIIANDVHGLAQRGVSTSTLGIGDDYSEDLLEAMARSGDGNFFHIQTPEQLPEIFETELSGLIATIGQQVILDFKPQNGVTIMDVLNDFTNTNIESYKLPPLIAGSPMRIVVRLQIPPLSQSAELLQVRLAWDDPTQAKRQSLRVGLALPLVSPEQFGQFPVNQLVQERVAILMGARARREAVHLSDQGDHVSAITSLSNVHEYMITLPSSEELQQEQEALRALEDDYRSGNISNARKKSISESYQISSGGESNPRRTMNSMDLDSD